MKRAIYVVCKQASRERKRGIKGQRGCSLQVIEPNTVSKEKDGHIARLEIGCAVCKVLLCVKRGCWDVFLFKGFVEQLGVCLHGNQGKTCLVSNPPSCRVQRDIHTLDGLPLPLFSPNKSHHTPSKYIPDFNRPVALSAVRRHKHSSACLPRSIFYPGRLQTFSLTSELSPATY